MTEAGMNLTKRLIGTALAFDLSLLMGHLHGVGTPKQWEARAQRVLLSATDWLGRVYNLGWRGIVHLSGYLRYSRRNYANFGRGGNLDAPVEFGVILTGC